MSMSSNEQIQPEDSLDDRGVEDILDEGISPPEKPRGLNAKGSTHREVAEGESLDERLAQEEPEADPYEEVATEDLDDDEVGDVRSGRLVAPDAGTAQDDEQTLVAEDVGIDGAAASAEEAAVHVVPEGEE